MGRRALDLYPETRPVSQPFKSKTMVACLKVADSPPLEAIQTAASRVHLMDPRYLPRGEVQWTCRVWVKEVLVSLARLRLVQLPVSVDRIEAYGLRVADALKARGIAKFINDLSWIPPPTVPMQIDPRPRYYGPSPMETEVARRGGDGYYGPSPMVTEVHRPRERVVEARRGAYYGPSPMATEVHRPREQIMEVKHGVQYVAAPGAPHQGVRYVNVVRR